MLDLDGCRENSNQMLACDDDDNFESSLRLIKNSATSDGTKIQNLIFTWDAYLVFT